MSALLLASLLAAELSQIDTLAEAAMREGHIPSLSLAVVAADRIVWRSAYGMSNLWARTEASPETVYMMGSIFKTMQAVVLLQLVEEGKLSLDDPVRRYLDGLEIRGGRADAPATFRHLLAHSSGILGQAEKGAFPDPVDAETMRVIPHWDRPFAAYPIWGYDVPPPIEEYLQKGLKAVRAPGERVEYSPMAFTLVAFITEKLSGRPFMRAMRERIFEPLDMTSTAFIPTAAMDERFAIPYVYDADSGEQHAVSRVRVAIWATGQVYGTAGDLAHWLIVNLNGGRWGEERLVSSELLAEAHTIQYPELAGRDADGNQTGYGLGWNVTERGYDRFISHSGSLPGETAFALGDLQRKTGVVILSNGNRSHRHLERLAYGILQLVD